MALLAVLSACSWWAALAADETSSGDKLRILYSNRFTFTDDDLPLVTVEIMSGQRSVSLGAEGGTIVRPDGDGGSAIRAGDDWTVTIESGRPARLREWTIVARLEPGKERRIERTIAIWKERGLETRRFEVGTIFAVDGEVMDTRQTLVVVDPVRAGRGARRARRIASRYDVETEVYAELVKRPEGTIVARSGKVEIRNPSVLWFTPARQTKTIRVDDVVAGGGGSQLRTQRENRRYFGSVYLTVGRDGALVVANAVAADQLLAGLVPSEIFPVAPMDALRAQAIAARTELLQKIGTRHLGDPYLLCSSQHCQVYSGAGREHPRTTRAVADTRGLVLTRKGGTELVDARYSAACGGHSEHNEVVWGGTPDPSLRGRADGVEDRRFADGVDETEIDAFLDIDGSSAHCGGTRFSKGRFRWTASIRGADLDRRVARSHPEVGSVRAIEPLTRGVSGRITKLRLRGSRGSAIVRGELTIRRLFGGLRSSLFALRVIEDEDGSRRFEFRGAGFGHGVGMCQLGAIGMAERKRDYHQILSHYYRAAELQRLY